MVNRPRAGTAPSSTRPPTLTQLTPLARSRSPSLSAPPILTTVPSVSASASASSASASTSTSGHSSLSSLTHPLPPILAPAPFPAPHPFADFFAAAHSPTPSPSPDPILSEPMPSPATAPAYITELRHRLVDALHEVQHLLGSVRRSELDNDYLCHQVTKLTIQREALRDELEARGRGAVGVSTESQSAGGAVGVSSESESGGGAISMSTENESGGGAVSTNFESESGAESIESESDDGPSDMVSGEYESDNKVNTADEDNTWEEDTGEYEEEAA
ncbi:hypothetical protein CC85DRAFT_285892 [Cutaneotrichosporon oleaginosum]|uniref:Uncharacterized protein n=1 Tax=Cutaneotrichosporon oleaginosum TaxID=879819 RepID=A0A0J1B3C8_9TREE|nr:uncharacterized protein CC85DRAFT_285892 [Cutaneotrichosporon oleaginosum]KLT42129.1 hypothetical protein CC85DRAFT_285892 [Cutaneotrichosporon oleaginosum]TXT04632.1 hypothetical protein COLE_07451 [Cutaneotrichosporon oleaginosum]